MRAMAAVSGPAASADWTTRKPESARAMGLMILLGAGAFPSLVCQFRRGRIVRHDVPVLAESAA